MVPFDFSPHKVQLRKDRNLRAPRFVRMRKEHSETHQSEMSSLDMTDAIALIELP